jgi:hypothetical protein
VDTDELVAALDPLQPAHLACASALRQGAEFTLWHDGTATPAELLDICRRRHGKLLEQGVETVGFEQALRDLESTARPLLRLGSVDVGDPPYHFAVFLAAQRTEVVACLGVDQAWEE